MDSNGIVADVVEFPEEAITAEEDPQEYHHHEPKNRNGKVQEASIGSLPSMPRKPGPKSKTAYVDQEGDYIVYEEDQELEEKYAVVQPDVMQDQRMDGRGRKKDPIHVYFTIIRLAAESKDNILSCNFCSVQRKSIPRFLRMHLAYECASVSDDVKAWVLDEIRRIHKVSTPEEVAAFIKFNSYGAPKPSRPFPAAKAPSIDSSSSVVQLPSMDTDNGPWSLAVHRERRSGKRLADDDDFSPDSDEVEEDDEYPPKEPLKRFQPVKRGPGRPRKIRPAIEEQIPRPSQRPPQRPHSYSNHVKANSNAGQDQYITQEERERREFFARIKKYETETAFIQTQMETWKSLTPIVSTFFESMNALVKDAQKRLVSNASSSSTRTHEVIFSASSTGTTYDQHDDID